jgi:hypothetical protein
MGHSLAQQKGTYDRRSKEQKVAPAVDLIKSINQVVLNTNNKLK